MVVDLEMLKKVIAESGMTLVAISKKSGIVRETLYNRLDGIGEFNASEIVGLSQALGLRNSTRDKIFFAKKVELKDTTG